MTGSDATEVPSAADPGRPRSRDELDPELVRLPRTRTRIGPVLGLAIALLCAITVVRLRGDLAFARRGDDPRAVTIAELARADDHDYVALTAPPDRAAMLHVFASRARDGHRLMPVIGGGGAAWLMLGGDPAAARPAAEPDGERYVGRVRRLGDLPFYPALLERLRATPTVPAVVDAAALRAALTGGAATIATATGEVLPIAPDTEVAVDQAVTGRARVTVSSTATHPDELTWRAALGRAGVLPSDAPPVSEDDGSWTYEVPAPDGVDGVARALIAARLFAARAEPLGSRRTAAWRDLAARPDELTIGGAAVPWTDVVNVTVAGRRPSPTADARVLVTGERPDDYWYVLPVSLLLAALAALFAWGTVRALREAAATRSGTPP